MSDRFSLADTFAIVTGGTRGIGRAISLRFARAGAEVVANYVRDEASALALREEAATEALALETIRADLTHARGLDAIRERVALVKGRRLCVVHCAATGVHRPFEQLTTRHYDWTMSLNVRAFFELMQQLMPFLVEGSTVLVLSSAGAIRAVSAYSLIGASKGALESLARHMAAELASRGVRVNIIAPGSVQTGAWDSFPEGPERLAEAIRRTPTQRLVTPEEIAFTAQFLASPAGTGIVGHTLVVDNGHRLTE